MQVDEVTEIDITGDVCPMTFVRVKLALERMAPDATLMVRLNDGEPLRNVPRSARAEGYVVEELGPESPGGRVHHLRITRQ
ncbi:MAG: sulfurtransferase TusA family protein [Alphaproteobacteria bacterium]|nr:sulfurtransferase TusA family protein [Alphaproteobacteria bacterium]MCW5743315.1 sulfurtransferase TusA family protein [Alphaproteobacteria bacterium]